MIPRHDRTPRPVNVCGSCLRGEIWEWDGNDVATKNMDKVVVMVVMGGIDAKNNGEALRGKEWYVRWKEILERRRDVDGVYIRNESEATTRKSHHLLTSKWCEVYSTSQIIIGKNPQRYRWWEMDSRFVIEHMDLTHLVPVARQILNDSGHSQ